MKKITALAIALFFTLNSFCQITSDPYLFAYWTFDSILDDFSSNGNHLGNSDGCWLPVTYQAGRDSTTNKALKLGSFYACKATTHFPCDDKSLQIDSGYNSWSVAAWITQAGAGYLVGNRNLTTLNDTLILEHNGQFSIGTTIDKRINVTLVDANGNLQVYETDSIYDRNKWNHVVCVFDKVKDSVIIYLNTQKCYSGKLVPMQQTQALMCVGGMYNYNHLTVNANWKFIERFFGKVDDMKIYTRALSYTDVTQLYLNDHVSGIGKMESEFNGMVYPNPVSDCLTIESTEPIMAMKLYSVLGDELFTETVNSTKAKIMFKNLTAGSYALMLTTIKGTYFKRIVKE